MRGAPDDRVPHNRPDEALRLHVMTGVGGDPAVEAAGLAVAQGVDALAVEEHHLTVTRHRALRDAAPGCASPVSAAPSNSCAWSRTRRRSPVSASARRSPTRPWANS